MKSALNVHHYISEDWFITEQDKLFGKAWIFACMKSAVAVDQAYVAREMGGIPIFIQNQSGEIRAFKNQCPHRWMPLMTTAFGQSKTVCPYHGWVFDGAHVKTIPKENDLYRYSVEERKALCLKEYAVRCIGELVFVNLSDDPIGIDAQFHQLFIDELVEVSSHFHDVSTHVNISTKYNWKLNFENVMDFNHIPYIHPKTFQPLIIKNSNKRTFDYKFDINSTLPDASFRSSIEMSIESWPWHQDVDAYGEPGIYQNLFIFPNVNFISLGGRVFLIQQFHPVGPNQTEVRFTLCTAKEKKRLATLPAILRSHLRAEVSVLLEDVAYLEALQASLHGSTEPVHHGAYESRLLSFGHLVTDWVKGYE